MPYIGNTPAEKYAAFNVQHFTTSATTSYTLTHAVANELDIRLVLNNVVQQPGASYAYTASATTLTLSVATTGTDTMYAVYIGKAVQTVTPGANSVGPTALQDNSVTNAKLADATQGDIIYYGAAGAPTQLGAGTSGYVLQTQGAGANPVWAVDGGVPSGVIAMWHGASAAIPSGWVICDGNNSTPNLTDKFIKSASTAGGTGGGTTTGATTLSTAQIPAHTHTLDHYVSGDTDHTGTGNRDLLIGGTWTTSSTGGGGSHTHTQDEPVYYALIFIMKT